MDWTVDHTGDPFLWQYGEALRLALLERCAAVGLDSVSGLDQFNHSHNALTSLQIPICAGTPLGIGSWAKFWYGIYNDYGVWSLLSYMNDFDVTVRTLVPYFVNHTDHNGNWSGLGVNAMAPVWTFDGLLTYLGITNLLYQQYPCFYNDRQVALPPTWAYMKQMYDILNMLKWTRLGFSIVESHAKGATGLTWAAAVAAFNITPWSVVPATSLTDHWAKSEYGYAIHRSNAKLRFDRDNGGSVISPISLQHQRDVYVMWNVAHGNVQGPHTYECADYPNNAVAGQWAFFEQGAGPDAFPYEHTFGEVDDCTVSDPDSALTHDIGWQYDPQYSWHGPPTVIAKWNVTGGFAFTA